MNMATKNASLEAVLEWFVSIIGAKEWEGRKRGIEYFLKRRSEYKHYDALTGEPHTPSDLAAWYLYLCESYLANSLDYDLFQGARVLPVFAVIGRQLALTKRIKGVEQKIRNVFERTPDQIDGLLFELLVGTKYLACGWNDVSFVPEGIHKTPDILAIRRDTQLYVECKRKTKSVYARSERERWLEIFRPVASYLTQERYSIVLQIEFHVELFRLRADYLERLLIPKLPLLVTPGIIVDNEVTTISWRFTDLARTRAHLLKNYVRRESALLMKLLFDYDQYDRGLTSHALFEFEQPEPRLVTGVEWAWAAIWSCDADEAIMRKARDVRDQLAEAAKQLPYDSPGAVHLAIESYEGEQVDMVRFLGILETMSYFEPAHPLLMWVYINVFEFTLPPDKNWDAFETCHRFDKDKSEPEYALADCRLLTDSDG